MLRRRWTVCAMTALLFGGTAAAQQPGTLLLGGFGQYTKFDDALRVCSALKTAGTATTLYGIDTVANQLVRIGGVDGTPSPNGGTITPVGPMGSINAVSIGGFDIGQDGQALATLTNDDTELTGLVAGHSYTLSVVTTNGAFESAPATTGWPRGSCAPAWMPKSCGRTTSRPCATGC